MVSKGDLDQDEEEYEDSETNCSHRIARKHTMFGMDPDKQNPTEYTGNEGLQDRCWYYAAAVAIRLPGLLADSGDDNDEIDHEDCEARCAQTVMNESVVHNCQSRSISFWYWSAHNHTLKGFRYAIV
jgi:hypothetical protein